MSRVGELRWWRTFGAVLVVPLGLCCLPATQARAQTPSVSTPATKALSAADKETARGLFLAGNDKYKQGDYEGALEAYSGADAIMHVPTTGYKVGKTLVQLGRLVLARDKLLSIARLARTGDESAAFRHARDQAGLLAEELRARIPSLRIDVTGPGPELPLTVVVDGRQLDADIARLPWRLDPGEHVVRVSAVGFSAQTQTVEVAEGEHEVMSFVLVARDSYEESSSASADLSPLVWVGFGVGAVGIIVGSITGGLSLSAAAELEDACEADGRCPPEQQSALDRATTTATVSTISFIAGGAGVALGVVGLLVGGDADDDTAGASAVVGPGYLGIGGRF